MRSTPFVSRIRIAAFPCLTKLRRKFSLFLPSPALMVVIMCLTIANSLEGAVVTVTDDFNRSDSKPVSEGGVGLGSRWSYGAPVDAYIDSNAATGMFHAAASSAISYYSSITLSDSLVLKADFYTDHDKSWQGLVFNYVDEDSYLLIRYKCITSGTIWQLLNFDNSTEPIIVASFAGDDILTLGSYYTMTLASTSVANEYRLTLTSADGLTTYIDRTLTISNALTGHAGFYLDTTVTASGALQADNFSLTTVPGSPSK